MRVIIYMVLPVLLLFLASCVTERVEKRPVHPFAFSPEERGGLYPGRMPPVSAQQRLPRSQYPGRGETRIENFTPSRLERFTGNPHLNR